MLMQVFVRRALLGVTVAGALVGLLANSPVQAQQRHARPPSAHPPSGPRWHGDIRQFHEHDWRVWRGGHWTHGPHGGHMGWWWVVGGVWYFYPAPIYPYPNPYEPPPAWAVPPASTAPPPPPTYWYYCESAKSYYPYVPTCPDGWKQVTAAPSSAASAPTK